MKDGAVVFDVKVECTTTIDPRSDGQKRGWVRASCEYLKVDFPANSTVGTMAGEPRKCSVKQGES